MMNRNRAKASLPPIDNKKPRTHKTGPRYACLVRDEKEFNERLEYMHLNPVKKGLVKQREDCRWPSYNNFALDKATVGACPIQIDYVRLPLGYRA
jgi:hypothetical protein